MQRGAKIFIRTAYQKECFPNFMCDNISNYKEISESSTNCDDLLDIQLSADETINYGNKRLKISGSLPFKIP